MDWTHCDDPEKEGSQESKSSALEKDLWFEDSLEFDGRTPVEFCKSDSHQHANGGGGYSAASQTWSASPTRLVQSNAALLPNAPRWLTLSECVYYAWSWNHLRILAMLAREETECALLLDF